MATIFLSLSLILIILHLDNKKSSVSNNIISSTILVLKLIEEFTANPFSATRVQFIFTNGKYELNDGIYSFIKKNKNSINPKEIFLIIEPCGFGNLGFIHTEGILKKHVLGGELYFHAEHMSRTLPSHPQPINLTYEFTEAQIIRNNGYNAISIGAFSDKTDILTQEINPETILATSQFVNAFIHEINNVN